jgi:hypothetical protein
MLALDSHIQRLNGMLALDSHIQRLNRQGSYSLSRFGFDQSQASGE